MACRAFHRLVAPSLSALALTACGRSEAAKRVLEGMELQPSASAAASASPVAVVPSGPSVASVAVASSATDTPPPLPTADGSAGSCRTVRGPIELPIRAPATFVVRGERVDVVLDDDGHPRITSFTAAPFMVSAPVSAPPLREPAEGAVRGMRLQCAAAGEVAFCPDRSGAVHRSGLSGEGDRVVAIGRIGTRVAAGLLGGAHTALAYLASRKTAEGWVSEAWLEVDDEPALRLSDDGSGATAVDLAARGGSLLALSIDARSALTAMHARSIAYDGGARLGEDAVVFVGGPGDRQTAGTLVLSVNGAGWALLPIARDVTEFGLAVVRLDDPPRVDEPTLWSMYPNGLDPASVAAAVHAGRVWVARVRPQTPAPRSAHVLELGEIGAAGAFAARDVVATGDSPTDVSLAAGPHGDLWLAWVDGSGSWVERLSCR